MMHLREKRCCAFAWNGEGDYVGVVADRQGDRVQVVRAWSVSGDSRSPAEILREGYAALGSPGDALVLIGGSTKAGYFKELTMPKMQPADLLRAVEFDLPKHCPLPVDSIRWGLRVTGDAEDGQRHVRLTIIPDQEWTSWIEAASGISRGVDMIMPPASALDPLLSEQPVCLGFTPASGCFELSPDGNGGRATSLIYSVHDHPDTFGLGPRPMETPNLRPGPLAEMAPEAAGKFTPAVVLAMYGLSRHYHADRAHWLEVPHELRPRRNRVLKVSAVLMVLFLIVSVVYVSATRYIASNQRQAAIDAQRRILSDHLAAYQASAKLDTEIDQLEVAMMDNLLSYRSLPEALLELSTTLDHDVHAARFSWNDGDLALSLSSMVDRPDQLLPLSQSELFTNFRQLKKELTKKGSVLYQVEMKQKDAHQLSEAVEAPELPSSLAEPPAEPPAEGPPPEAAPDSPDGPPGDMAPDAGPPSRPEPPPGKAGAPMKRLGLPPPDGGPPPSKLPPKPDAQDAAPAPPAGDAATQPPEGE